ncbi:hypothetical protein [Massilia sp. TN1-12]|uniref:hypothetical protein n=1 Tax=Massilia paldalensis TaxID=3377675 RepID=UPI00384DBF65
MSLTPREHLKLHGSLPERQLEQLIEWRERTEEVVSTTAYLQEARGQYPAEDFLACPIERLHQLAKKLRGENREALLGIIESLDDIAQTTFNAADYGRSELRKAEAALGSLDND